MNFTPIRYKQCDECKDKAGPKGQPGFYYVDIKEKATSKVTECECHKKWVKTNRIYIGAHKNNLNVDMFSIQYDPTISYRGKHSKKEIDKLYNYVLSYDEEKVRELSLYIYGGDQTQKTTVAQFIGLSVFRQGYSAFYTNMKIFNSMVCKPFPKADEAEAINEYMGKMEKADLLILDEAFDKNSAPVYDSGMQSPYIEGFIRNRVESLKKGILFVSRVKPHDIKKNGYSESLQSFVVNHTEKVKTALEFKDIITNFEINELFKDVE